MGHESRMDLTTKAPIRRHGNLEDWWTKEDGEKFTEKAQCIVDE